MSVTEIVASKPRYEVASSFPLSMDSGKYLLELTNGLNLCTLSGQHAHSSSLFDYINQNRTKEFDSLQDHRWALNATTPFLVDNSTIGSLSTADTKTNIEKLVPLANVRSTSDGFEIVKSSSSSSASKESSSGEYSLVKETSYHSEGYEYDSSDDDDDDDDYDFEHYDDKHSHHKKSHHHQYKKKGGKKKKKKKKVVYKVHKKSKKPKKVKVHYGKAYYPAKKVRVVSKQHHSYPKGKHHHDKKVTYAYVYEDHNPHYHGHDKKGGKYHDYHHHSIKDNLHSSKYGSKGHHAGRVSFAGLFGYTLLCVNYLMMLKEPQHDKYHSSYPDHHYAASHYHYSSKEHDHHHGKHKDSHYQVKLGHHKSGPVILAHCATDLREPSAELIRKARDIQQIIDSVEEAQQAISGQEKSTDTLKDKTTTPRIQEAPASNNQSQSSASGKLAKESTDSNQHYLSPTVRSYLNQYVWQEEPQLRQRQVITTSGDNEQSEVIMIGGRGNSGAQTIDLAGDSEIGSNAGQLRPGQVQISTNSGLNQRLQLVNLIGDPNAPQLVARRDNLITERSRPVDISMRVVARSHFAMAPLREDPELSGPPEQLGIVSIAGRAGAGLLGAINDNGVRAGDAVLAAGQVGPLRGVILNGNSLEREQELPDNGERMLADQPQGPDSGLVLDLPDYALAGDSIKLTCNHRMALNRIYSVKWFKDSLEFYRFVPANGPRPKSFLALPDLRLDLAHSNSESVLLRNLSHRSSGLYRCEVVSGELVISLQTQERHSSSK